MVKWRYFEKKKFLVSTGSLNFMANKQFWNFHLDKTDLPGNGNTE